MKTLAIIPARGGSKRLPRKNIRDFLGQPLLAWTVKAAQESEVFERIILLTDDEEVATVGASFGAEVPFREPAEFATDTAYIADALRYALEKLSSDEQYAPPHFILLEPSAVGRTPEQIRDVARIMHERNDFDSLVGISEVPAHFSYLKQLAREEDGVVARVGDGTPLKLLTHRNQNLAKSYYINSAIYAFRRKNLFEGKRELWGESTYGYVMDSAYIADIDTEEDWLIAEAKIRRKLESL